MKAIHLWLLAVAVGMMGCGGGSDSGGEGADSIGTPEPTARAQECPKEWGEYLRDRGIQDPQDRFIGELSGPQGFQDIPEFHDCQRFISGDRAGYGGSYSSGIFAVFAVGDSTAIGEIPADRSGLYQAEGEAGNAVPAAQILADQPYDPLGIGPGVSCAYIYKPRDGEWEAAIRWDQNIDRGCSDPIPAGDLLDADQFKRLRVLRTTGLGPDAYPGVARWTWFRRQEGSEYRIGVSCDGGWCEMMPLTSPPHVEDSYADNVDKNPSDPELRRVRRGKAWYDEQVLAEGSGGALKPSNILGTVFPHPDLGRYTTTMFDGEWLPAAEVALSPVVGFSGTNPYADPDKLNFSLTHQGGGLNTISLCRGSWERCRGALEDTNLAPEELARCVSKDETDWWARLQPPGGTPVFRCVSRCPYSVLIPGTVRWNWLSDDEGIWMRCVNGCCEVGPPPQGE